MPGRGGSTCLAGSTRLISEIDNEVTTISNHPAGFEVKVDFSPSLNVTVTDTLSGIRPIKAYSGNYVFPIIKFVYNVQTIIPLLQIRAKIPIDGVQFDSGDCDPMGVDPNFLCKEIKATLLHPFMSERETMQPAYSLEVGDKILVNSYSNPIQNLRYEERGIITSIVEIPSPSVYGLILCDENARNFNFNPIFDAITENIIPSIRELSQDAQFDAIVNPIRRFVKSQYLSSSGRINGLTPQDHVIFTDGFATGSIDLQDKLFGRHRNGYTLDDLF